MILSHVNKKSTIVLENYIYFSAFDRIGISVIFRFRYDNIQFFILIVINSTTIYAVRS